MLKCFLYIIPLLIVGYSCQTNSIKKESSSQSIKYDLPIPAKWTSEIFPVPPSFASDLKYKGTEEIRFTPGWAQSNSSDYWSYIFLWALKGKVTLTNVDVAYYLEKYYTGLVSNNLKSKAGLTLQELKTDVNIESYKESETDLKAFQGTINMIDYMSGRRIQLFCKVHVLKCSSANTYILHELSPMPFTEDVWKKFDEVRNSTTCN